MKFNKYILFGLFAALLFTACSNDNDDNLPNNNQNQLDDPTDELRFSKAAQNYVGYETDFALDMLRELEASSDETIALSPLGFYEVLAMIANADDDVVAPEIINVLSQGNLKDLVALNEYNRIMMKVLPNLDKSVTFYNNNAIAHQKGIKFDENYMARMKTNFLPEIIEYNVADGNMHLLINDWAAKTTNNVIKDFLQNPLPSELALLNSNYMKGDWKYPFEDYCAELNRFTNYDGTFSKVPYFRMNHIVPSFCAEGIKGVEFPIGEGKFSFVALMPEYRNTDISEVTAKLNKDLLNNLISQKEEKDIAFKFPHFNIETGTCEYTKLLESMGITNLKKPIKGIFANGVAAFDMLLQKSSISVCRTGMEAASVTAAVLSGSPGIFDETPNEIIFEFTRPFVFLVRENSTGAIIYIGQIKSLPNQEENIGY